MICKVLGLTAITTSLYHAVPSAVIVTESKYFVALVYRCAVSSKSRWVEKGIGLDAWRNVQAVKAVRYNRVMKAKRGWHECPEVF